ncbi:MAG: MATE family efflux transporter [Akkermansia sp.]|nr:MATE family efflux transporter [Akkermansia sp.]
MAAQISDHFTYRKLFAFVLPPIAMMLLTSVYTMVDGLFVSHFVGKIAFAAVNFVFPVIVLMSGLGFMFGSGGTALVAKTLGHGAEKRARRYFTQVVLLAAGLGTIAAAVGLVWLPEICLLLGGTPDLLPDALTYGRIMLAFLPCCILQWSFQSLLIAAEKPNFAFWLSVAGGVTNVALDALFMACFGWGVAGAAVATGISQVVAGVVPVVYFLFPNGSLLRFRRTRMQPRPMLQACSNGASELVSGISGALVGMLYNYQLLRYYGEDGVAAFGVVMYVSFFFVSIFIGYDMGSSPLFAYHHGADNRAELRNLFRKSFLLISLCSLCLAASAVLFSRPLAVLFVGYNESLAALTQHAFCLYGFSFALMGLNIFASGLFTAMNNGLISALISFARTFAFQVLAVLLLPLLVGTDGIWWSVSVAEVAALALSVFFVLRYRKRYGYL